MRSAAWNEPVRFADRLEADWRPRYADGNRPADAPVRRRRRLGRHRRGARRYRGAGHIVGRLDDSRSPPVVGAHHRLDGERRCRVVADDVSSFLAHARSGCSRTADGRRDLHAGRRGRGQSGVLPAGAAHDAPILRRSPSTISAAIRSASLRASAYRALRLFVIEGSSDRFTAQQFSQSRRAYAAGTAASIVILACSPPASSSPGGAATAPGCPFC